jgi:thiamine pyrophosphokinase
MKHTCLVLGGLPPSNELLRHVLGEVTTSIAADSGYDAFARAGCEPTLLVGDLDSIETPLDSISCPVHRAPEQDATDFEKALRYLPEATEYLTLLGATGRRLDHFLTNLLIAQELDQNLNLRILDDEQSVHRLRPHTKFVLHAPPGTLLSLIPFPTAEGVSTTGLHWNLSQANMSALGQLSQSNRVENRQITVTFASGSLFLVLNRSPLASEPESC